MNDAMDIRKILSDDSIMDVPSPLMEVDSHSPPSVKITIPRTGMYAICTRCTGEHKTEFRNLNKDQVIELPLYMVGDSLTLLPETAKGKPMRCYAINISVPTIEPLDIVPPYQVMAGGRVDKPDDDRPIFQQFSEAKTELVKLLQVEREKVNNQIKAVRRLTRGRINRMMESPTVQPAAPQS